MGQLTLGDFSAALNYKFKIQHRLVNPMQCFNAENCAGLEKKDKNPLDLYG